MSSMTTGARHSSIPLSSAAGFLECYGYGGQGAEPTVEVLDSADDFEAQCETAYALLREGYSELEVVSELRKIYTRSCPAIRVYRSALEALVEEQRAAREFAPELLAATRQRAIRVGLATGQVAAVAALLRDTENGLQGVSEELSTLKVEVMQPGPYAPIGRLSGQKLEDAAVPDNESE
jgi:hypothetical protein